MPRNSRFRFKQFLIDQDKCGMKVCTDSCIFGAYAEVPEARTILDIGTGTGLLALMTAQRSEAAIDAVEIDPEAAAQAQENVNLSPWKDRIRVIREDIRNFRPEKLYDVIICNPPFFSGNLKSGSRARNLAMHGEELSFKDVLASSVKLLNPAGRLWMLLPGYESGKLNELAETEGLFLFHTLYIRERISEKILRVISCFGKGKEEFSQAELVIRNEAGEYSGEFRDLLKAYYLDL